MNPVVKADLAEIHSKISHTNWRDSVIIITGCAGFLGFYLLNYFLEYSSELGLKQVIGLDNYILGSPDWLARLAEKHGNKLLLKKHNIATDDLSKIQCGEMPVYVIHAASIASPSFYRKYPMETVDSNVFGLRKLFEHTRLLPNLRGLLYFSSSEIYGDPDASNIPTSEEYRGSVSCVGPRACYDEAKRFCETLCSLYGLQYSLPIVVVRPFNNYGPGMRLGDKRLPADIASSVMSNQDIIIRSDGTPTRAFCYVADAISGYLLALNHQKYDYFNIGSDFEETSVGKFAECVRDIASENFSYDKSIKYIPSQDQNYLTDNPSRRLPNIGKARSILGYNPTVSLDDGVMRYLSFLNYEKRV